MDVIKKGCFICVLAFSKNEFSIAMKEKSNYAG